MTVWNSAGESCPVLPGAGRTLRWPFEEPAAAESRDEDKIALFRRIRDQIRTRIAVYLTGAENDAIRCPDGSARSLCIIL